MPVHFPRPLLPDGSDGLRLEVRQFLNQQAFVPRCGACQDSFDPGLSRNLAARGWVGMAWPADYGGRGRPLRDSHVVAEELVAAGAPVAAHWFADRQIGTLLVRYGSEELKRELLPAIARGDCRCCVSMPGPAPGEQRHGPPPSARPVDGGYRVTADGIWACHARGAHFLLLSVAISQGARESGPLSHLLVGLHDPGVETRPGASPALGLPLEPVSLHEVFVPQRRLVGREGEGREQGLVGMAVGRGGPEQFLKTFPLLRATVDEVAAAEPHGQETLGRLAARLWALRRLSLSVAGAAETGQPCELEAALVEALGARFERDVVEAARSLAVLQALTGGPLAELLGQAVPAVSGFAIPDLQGVWDGIVRVERPPAGRGPAAQARELFARWRLPALGRDFWSPALWQELEGSGLTGIGTALPLIEAAAVVREAAAAAAAAVPLAETVLVGWLRGPDAPVGPLTVVHRGRAPYGRVAAALLSGDGFIASDGIALEPAVNLAGEPLDRVAVPDASGADVGRLGALIRGTQIVGAMERVLEITARLVEEQASGLATAGSLRQRVALAAADVASAATTVQHALEFPGECEVAAAKIRSGEAATATAALAHEVVGAIGLSETHELWVLTGRLWSWRDDFGGAAEWARLLGGLLCADPGLLWGHAPARGTD